MIETHLSLFDAVVVGILLISCVFAFFRGFVREVLSLGAWIGAGIVTLYYFPSATEKLLPYFKTPVVAAGFATLGLYLVALMGFSLINMFIIKFLKSGDEVGPTDNILGLIFGAMRGVFIVTLGFFLLVVALPEKEYPDWLKASVTLPYVEKGTAVLVSVAPEYLRDMAAFQKKTAADVKQGKGLWNREPEDHAGDSAYDEESAERLDRMIENMQGGENSQ